MKINKSGQVWVETVVYTLIAFALIGTVLTFIKPKIEELQDKTLIDQSIEMLKDINSIIYSIGPSGNVRLIEVTVKKGSLEIDPVKELITFETESNLEYSEPGEEIERDNLIILTEKGPDKNTISVSINYSPGYNLTVNNQDSSSKIISKSLNPYKLLIKNEGIQDQKTWINIDIN